jgi:hypothetical protein
MLKKEETIKGAIVEVFQIKKGVGGFPADAPSANGVLITAQAGGFFNGGKCASVGTKLEIVEPPKRRDGINTVVVKIKGEDEEFQGHVFWCELRASCKLVQAAPAAAVQSPSKPAKKAKGAKVFTDKQLARLPALGYWVCTYPGGAQAYYCVMNGAVKYIHESWGTEWNTLTWSCCPTAKMVAENRDGQYQHFADHASLVAKLPNIKDGARVKSPNDF